jgi:uncharacterized membrane protein YsdA (DUF1294 family)
MFVAIGAVFRSQRIVSGRSNVSRERMNSRRLAKPSAVRRHNRAAPRGTATYFAIVVFVVLYLSVAMLGRVPNWVAGVYAGTSLLTFVLYAFDKSAAAANTWRISESTLLLIGLVGGWPGAIVAQQILRHKSSKASFRSAFWGTVLINIVGFLLVFSPIGKNFFSS